MTARVSRHMGVKSTHRVSCEHVGKERMGGQVGKRTSERRGRLHDGHKVEETLSEQKCCFQ